VTTVAVVVGAGVVVTTAVRECLEEEEAAAPTPPTTQQATTMQMMIGITTKSTKQATDTPTAMPTMLLAKVVNVLIKLQSVLVNRVPEQEMATSSEWPQLLDPIPLL